MHNYWLLPLTGEVLLLTEDQPPDTSNRPAPTSDVRWYFLQLVSNAILSDLVFPTVRLQPLNAGFTLPFQEILFIKIIQVPLSLLWVLTCSQLSSSTGGSTVHPSLPSQLILPALARKKQVPVPSPEIPKHPIWLGPLWKLSLPPSGKQRTLTARPHDDSSPSLGAHEAQMLATPVPQSLSVSCVDGPTSHKEVETFVTCRSTWGDN